jgi:hypothetical protein
LQGVRAGAVERDAGREQAPRVATLAVATPALVQPEQVAVALAAPVGRLGDHLGRGLEVVGQHREHRERPVPVRDLTVGRRAERPDVAQVHRRAVEAVRHDPGDEQRPVAHLAQRLGPGAAGLGPRRQVLQRQRPAAPPGDRRLVHEVRQQMNDVRFDLSGEAGPRPGLRLADLVEEEGFERTIERELGCHLESPPIAQASRVQRADNAIM